MFTKSRNKHVAKISCKYIKVCGQAKTKKRKRKKQEGRDRVGSYPDCEVQFFETCVSLRLSIPDLLFGSVGGLLLSIHLTVFMSLGSLIPNIKQLSV